MKIKERPRLELLYRQDNLIIPLEKGQIRAVHEFLDTVGQIDPTKDYTIKIEPTKRKRSLDANAYYHVLAKKCALKMGITFAEYHNRTLAEHGVAWEDKEGKKHWILQKDDDFWLKQIETHFCPTDKTECRNGVTYRWFYLLKPSRFFDTKEMSTLIDTTIQDAKSLGIETLPENEIKRMEQSWKNGNR